MKETQNRQKTPPMPQLSALYGLHPAMFSGNDTIFSSKYYHSY